MTNAPLRLTPLLALALLGACEKDNPGFCGDDCPIVDAGIDAVVGCEDDPGVCTVDQNCFMDTCVDCEAGDNRQSSQCETAAAPVCDANRSCRACRADAECDSDFCENGECIAAANVVYVAKDGTDTETCSQAAPCASPATGMSKVTASRKYMKIAASPAAYVLDNVRLSIDKDVVIHGAGAELKTNVANQVVDVTGGANALIDGLTISEAVGGGGGDGIRCASSTLTLRRASVLGNSDRGVEAADCAVFIDRSVLARNGAGGARIADGRFSIVNSFVFANGANVGLFVSPTDTPNLLESNTIVKNIGGAVGGVSCDGGVAIIARNNLIYANTGTAETSGANCAHSYSVIGALNPPSGVMVRSMTPAELALKNLATGASVDDFHIDTAANPPSLLRGAAAPGSTPLVDFDGDVRPNPAGGPADIGADEVP
jgi:hypothetical protein